MMRNGARVVTVQRADGARLLPSLPAAPLHGTQELDLRPFSDTLRSETHFFTILYRAEAAYRLIGNSGRRTIGWRLA